MHIAVSERMEEVQRKTSEKTQARQSQSWPGQCPVVCCIRAPGMTRSETNMSVTARDSSNRLGGWRRARLHRTEINTRRFPSTDMMMMEIITMICTIIIIHINLKHFY